MNNLIKILISLIFVLNCSLSFATTSYFPLTITPSMIPAEPSGGSNVGTAVGVAVGTTGGIAAAAGGGAYLSPFLLPGLILGFATDASIPLLAFCLDDEKVMAKIKADAPKYPLIAKAVSSSPVHKCSVSKYIFIYDTKIRAGNFNIISLKLPKELLNQTNLLSFKITQISDPFKLNKDDRPELDSRLFINKSLNDINKLYSSQRYLKAKKGTGEVKTTQLNADGPDGILQKYGEIDFSKETNDTAFLVTSFNPNGIKSALKKGVTIPNQQYAVLIEFSNLDKNSLIK